MSKLRIVSHQQTRKKNILQTGGKVVMRCTKQRNQQESNPQREKRKRDWKQKEHNGWREILTTKMCNTILCSFVQAKRDYRRIPSVWNESFLLLTDCSFVNSSIVVQFSIAMECSYIAYLVCLMWRRVDRLQKRNGLLYVGDPGSKLNLIHPFVILICDLFCSQPSVAS